MKKNLIAIGAGLIILILLALFVPPRMLLAPSTDTTSTVDQPTSSTSATNTTVPQLPTKYITSTNWPPQFSISADPFSCTAGTTNGQTTVEKTVNGHDYCITTLSESTAGNVYTTYTYLTSVQGNTLQTKFTLQYPQCANYPDTQKTECLAERGSFNIDSYIDDIITNATSAQN